MSEEKKDLVENSTELTTEESKPKKKKFVVAGQDAYGMYYLGYEGGGELPDKLKGEKYTSKSDIEIRVRLLNEGK